MNNSSRYPTAEMIEALRSEADKLDQMVSAITGLCEKMGVDIAGILNGSDPNRSSSAALMRRAADALAMHSLSPSDGAIELLAQLEEIGGNKAGAFTLRNEGAVGEVFEKKLSILLTAIERTKDD